MSRALTFKGVDQDVTFPGFATWERCPDCSGGPRPGARALLAYWLESFEPIARSMGIYNCRPVRGSSSLSIHACGRAVDLGVPVTTEGHQVMYEFLRRIAPHAKALGVQLVIFNATSGSARHPWPREYRGVHPHHDHAHVELNDQAAGELTLATLRARVGDYRDVVKPEPPTEPEPADWREEAIAAMETVNLSGVRRGKRSTYVEGASVRRLQALLAAAGHAPENSFDRRGHPDGVAGPATRGALGAFQRKNRTGKPSSPASADYVAGRATWTALVGA